MEVYENEYYRLEYVDSIKSVIFIPKPLHIEGHLEEFHDRFYHLIKDNHPLFCIADLTNISIITNREIIEAIHKLKETFDQSKITQLFLIEPKKKLQLDFFKKINNTVDTSIEIPPFITFNSVDEAIEKVKTLL